MTIELSVSSVPRVLLVDLDNCPKQMEHLHHSIEQFTRVIACYGGTEPKVPLNIVTFLAQAINSGRLEIVGMEKNGKNAADFGLTFWAGRLMAELPPETDFTILSQDKDLDHAVNLLRSANRTANRFDGKTHYPHLFTDSTGEAGELVMDASLETDVEEYFSCRLHSGISRPRSKKTLLNNIKIYFKQRKVIEPEDILRGLLERQHVIIDSQNKVTYVDEIIHANDDDDDEGIPF